MRYVDMPHTELRVSAISLGSAIQGTKGRTGSENLWRLGGLVVAALFLLLLVGCGDRALPESAETPVSGEIGAGNADVLPVRAVQDADGTWTFHVTVEHPDTGWEDYADGWDIVLPSGEIINPDPETRFTRLLLHPHESEQPFTRSQSGIRRVRSIGPLSHPGGPGSPACPVPGPR